MSKRTMPDDTVKVLETLIKESKGALEDLPLMRRLLLRGAIIDAEDLLAEITGASRKDTHAEAIKVLRDEARLHLKPT
jgi:hypothetical protein